MGTTQSRPTTPEQISVRDGGANSAVRTWPGTGADEAITAVTSAGSTFGLLSRSADKFPSNNLLGYRKKAGESPYEWISFTDARKQIVQLANTLMSEYGVGGSAPGNSSGLCTVGVYGKNCPAWMAAQYAINAAGGVLVPIYDTLGADIVEYVCNHAEIETVFVETANWDKFEAARGKCTTVKHAIRFDAGKIDSLSGAEDTIGACIARGSDDVSKLPQVGCDNVNVIMYTSGTTGHPKGVVHTNGTILTSIGSAYKFFAEWDFHFEAGDTHLSYLPLSHIMEQQAEALLIGVGGAIGYYSGNIKLLTSDLEALKPTIFIGVPRVFARFQQRIEEVVKGGSKLKQTLFNWAYNRQLMAVQQPGKIGRNKLWDYLVMNKVRAKLLPNVRLIITGSAPMSAQTNDFLKIVLNAPVLQGYGLTETVGGMCCSAPHVSVSGTCGGPVPGVLVKLHDLPEMGYMNSNSLPQGEVCIKGDIVFKEYYKNKDATLEAFDADGFFHTGDVGQWNADGTLQIVDRAKNLFKLSQGEYVSPEALEQEYAKSSLVLQIFVYGDSLESTLLAVVVPDKEKAIPWGQKHGLNTLADIAASPEFKAELMKQLLDEHKKAQFKSYERIRDVIIEVDDLNELGQGFHVGNNLSTPTFKLKRPQLKKKYKEQLDELYAKAKQ